MKRLWVLGLTALIVASGCGPSEKALNIAQQRIDALKAKGVPDSALSSAKVFHYQTKEAKRLSNHSLSRQANDSLDHALASAEALYTDHIARLKPSIDSLMMVLNSAEKNLTGMQKKKLDSMQTKVDSFVRIEWYLQANTKAAEAVAMLPALQFDEQRAKELTERIPGEWVCVNVTKGQENKAINSTEKKTFSFSRDGKAKLIETKKGQSGPFLRENWEFLSYGTWGCKGDTICLMITRFNIKQQDFERYTVEDGKKFWKKEQQPTYDSTITDGSQDRYITFVDLKEDFKQEKKF